MKNGKDIFDWAWEQRKNKVDPDEPQFSMAETLKVLKHYSDPQATEKKIRDYEVDGVVKPHRTKGGHRLFSVSNIICLHLMMSGTKYLGGKANTKPIVKLYELSRRQPKGDPTIFDHDPKLPGEKKIHNILHKPLFKNPIKQVSQLMRIVSKIDTFLHINDFARQHRIAFKCQTDELLEVKRDGKTVMIAPPVISWRSVQKALAWNQFYYAEARVKEVDLKTRKKRNSFEDSVNKKILQWLLKRDYAVKLKK